MRVLLVCFCLASLSCRTVHNTTLQDIPLLTCSGLPCVEVSLDGSAPLRLFIDLASNSSYITAVAAEKAKLAGIFGVTVQKHGSSPSFRPTIAYVSHLKLGPLMLSESFLVADPISGLSLSSSPRDVLPPGDGALSYDAFGDRLFILDIPHHRLRVSTGPYRKKSCSDCGRFTDVPQGCFGPLVLATDGFAINGHRIEAIIDSLYPGAVIAMEPIQRLLEFEGRLTRDTYRGDSLRFVRSVSVTFEGHTLSTSAPLVRVDQAYDAAGRQYDSVIGLSLLSTHAFAFDFGNRTMWLADSV